MDYNMPQPHKEDINLRKVKIKKIIKKNKDKIIFFYFSDDVFSEQKHVLIYTKHYYFIDNVFKTVDVDSDIIIHSHISKKDFNRLVGSLRYYDFKMIYEDYNDLQKEYHSAGDLINKIRSLKIDNTK